MSPLIRNTLIYSIAFLLLFAWWTSLTLGTSTDEYFHHINGLKRYNFLITLGEDTNFHFRNNEFYPGLYDTISYALGQIILLINKKFYADHIDFVMHLINVLFSTLSIIGLYIFTKKVFNKNISYIAVFLTLLNPFFFGHMGMNSKDIVVFFALIWFCYFFYLYCVEENKIFKNLLLSSFFLGFGCGVRLTFLVVVFPVVVCGIVYLLNKFKSDYLSLTKRLIPHILIAFFITIFLVVLCWPHIFTAYKSDNLIRFLSIVINNTINWNAGPLIGILNGDFYEVFNTPKTYFLYFFFFRLPIYFSLLLIFSYFLVISKKLLLINEISNFKIKFLVINIIAFFPIFLALILSVNIYDNIRLFLFIIPFFCIVASFAIYELLTKYNINLKYKVLTSIILIFFSLSLYRFILLTPYQYTYVNYTYPNFKKTEDKFEQDYWGATYKELIKKMKSKYTIKEVQQFKVADCFGGDMTLLYYLSKNFGVKRLYNIDEVPLRATHIVVTNRSVLNAINNPLLGDLVDKKGVIKTKNMAEVVRTPGVKTTCFSHYTGEELAKVTRGGVKLSAFRKLDK